MFLKISLIEITCYNLSKCSNWDRMSEIVRFYSLETSSNIQMTLLFKCTPVRYLDLGWGICFNLYQSENTICIEFQTGLAISICNVI